MKKIIILSGVIALYSTFAFAHVECKSDDMPGKKSKNLRAVFDLVDDNSVQNVEVSVLNAKLGEYVSIANVKESSASEYNPRNPELQDYNRFKLVDEKASSYQLLLPAKVTNLQSPYRGYLRVAFDCGRPFTDQMSCSEL